MSTILLQERKNCNMLAGGPSPEHEDWEKKILHGLKSNDKFTIMVNNTILYFVGISMPTSFICLILMNMFTWHLN